MCSSVGPRQMAPALLYMNFMKGSSSYKGRGKIVCTGDSLKSLLLTCTAFVRCHKKNQSLASRIYVCDQFQHVPFSCALWPFEERSKLESFPQLNFQGRKLGLNKNLAVRKVCIIIELRCLRNCH